MMDIGSAYGRARPYQRVRSSRLRAGMAAVILALAVALPAAPGPARAAEDQSPAAKEDREYQRYRERREQRLERQQERAREEAERARDKALREEREQEWQQRRKSLEVPPSLSDDAIRELRK